MSPCAKCGRDWSDVEYRTCCGCLWHACGKCGYQWPAYPLDDARNRPADNEQLSTAYLFPIESAPAVERQTSEVTPDADAHRHSMGADIHGAWK